jgi:hypothetical protein
MAINIPHRCFTGTAMKLAIVTDAEPQSTALIRQRQTRPRGRARLGHDVTVIAPPDFRTIPCPTYPEIRLALLPGRKLAAVIDRFEPDAIHVATEGRSGLPGVATASATASRSPRRITRSFRNTCASAPIPENWSYAFLRHHHRHARRTSWQPSISAAIWSRTASRTS